MENFAAGQKVRSTLGKIFTVTGQVGHRVFVEQQASWLHAEISDFGKEMSKKRKPPIGPWDAPDFAFHARDFGDLLGIQHATLS
jgi:hypothetical protein